MMAAVRMDDEMGERKTLQARIDELGITMEVKWGAPENPEFKDSTGYTVVLRREGSRKVITTPFYMGPAHTTEPKPTDVLECLLSDVAGVESADTFEEWCAELGYDTDSRRAERIYQNVHAEKAQLRSFLGDHYQAFLYDTESE
jgi:hypothetical protein